MVLLLRSSRKKISAAPCGANALGEARAHFFSRSKTRRWGSLMGTAGWGGQSFLRIFPPKPEPSAGLTPLCGCHGTSAELTLVDGPVLFGSCSPFKRKKPPVLTHGTGVLDGTGVLEECSDRHPGQGELGNGGPWSSETSRAISL